jgi:hypothetical protein
MSRENLGRTLHFLWKIFPSGDKEAAPFYRNLQDFAGLIAAIVTKKIQWTNQSGPHHRVPDLLIFESVQAEPSDIVE